MQEAIETAIRQYEAANEALVDAVEAELEAEQARTTTRDEIASSLVGNPNPLTGKPHSATSAHDAASQTTEYMAAAQRHRQTIVAKTSAQGAAIAARLRAEALIACAKLGVAA